MLNIAHRVNMTLYAAEVPSHIRIHPLNYTPKRNLSGLMAHASTSSMIIHQHRELVLKAAREIDQDIIDATGD